MELNILLEADNFSLEFSDMLQVVSISSIWLNLVCSITIVCLLARKAHHWFRFDLFFKILDFSF